MNLHCNLHWTHLNFAAATTRYIAKFDFLLAILEYKSVCIVGKLLKMFNKLHLTPNKFY